MCEGEHQKEFYAGEEALEVSGTQPNMSKFREMHKDGSHSQSEATPRNPQATAQSRTLDP